MNPVLILSGYNNRGVVAFCRFFKEQNILFFIVSSGKDDLINHTEYKENILCERTENNLNISEFIRFKTIVQSRTKAKNILILPSTEFLNRFLLNEKTQLEEEGFIIPLVNENLYSEISDKYSFGELCERKGITIPQEYEEVDDSKIPFVAKPKQYFVNGKAVNKKPLIISNLDQFHNLNKLRSESDYYFQEFVGGKSFYLLYYFDKEGNYFVYSQQNLIQQDNGLSIIGAESSDFHHQEISEKFAKIFLEKNYFGLLMIEVKVYDKQIYMIEANPRVWGPSQLILDSGMDLMHRFALDNGLLNENGITLPTYITGIKYFWSGGIFEDQQQNKEIVFHQYDANCFFKEYKNWVLSDIYMRNDTKDLFHKELNI